MRVDPFRCDDVQVLETYLATVVLGSHLDNLPVEEHAGFVGDVRLALRSGEVVNRLAPREEDSLPKESAARHNTCAPVRVSRAWMEA